MKLELNLILKAVFEIAHQVLNINFKKFTLISCIH